MNRRKWKVENAPVIIDFLGWECDEVFGEIRGVNFMILGFLSFLEVVPETYSFFQVFSEMLTAPVQGPFTLVTISDCMKNLL